MNQELKDIFERARTGSVPTLPDFPLNKELDEKGRVLGTGPVKIYSSLVQVLLPINMTLLILFLGIRYGHVLSDSPLLKIVGHVVAFLLLVASQIATFIYYVITGDRGPMHSIASQLPCGNWMFKGISSLIPMAAIVTAILMRTYRKVYISEGTAITLLVINSIIGLILGSVVIRYLQIILR